MKALLLELDLATCLCYAGWCIQCDESATVVEATVASPGCMLFLLCSCIPGSSFKIASGYDPRSCWLERGLASLAPPSLSPGALIIILACNSCYKNTQAKPHREPEFYLCCLLIQYWSLVMQVAITRPEDAVVIGEGIACRKAEKHAPSSEERGLEAGLNVV